MKSTVHLTKQQRIQLVLEGVLSEDYISYDEVMEVLNAVEQLILEKQQTHDAPETLQ